MTINVILLIATQPLKGGDMICLTEIVEPATVWAESCEYIGPPYITYTGLSTGKRATGQPANPFHLANKNLYGYFTD